MQNPFSLYTQFSTAFTKILSDVSALDAGKMRELIAAQYNDKFDAEWRWLDTLASGIYDGFTEMINLMLTGLPIASDKGEYKCMNLLMLSKAKDKPHISSEQKVLSHC